jgi:hypothetical protein
VRDERYSDERLFGHWAMELVQARGRFFSARHDLATILPPGLPEPVRERVLAMAERVAAEVEL